METPGFNNGDGSNDYYVEISPGSTEYFVPNCEVDEKPVKGKKFPSLEEGINFYKNYAAKCGFDARRGSDKRFRDGTIQLKYVYCNRQGDKHVEVGNQTKAVGDDINNDVGEDENNIATQLKQKRRRVSKRCGCPALVQFKYCAGGSYVVSEFIEKHSHILVSEPYKVFLKENRNLDPAHKQFMLNCAKANIGATRAYRLYKEFSGGYSNIGCTKVEFKNFARDLKAYVVGFDAQMLIDKLFRKKQLSPAFVFEYAVDESEKLTRVFWADSTCRRNYAAFGDVISFDATYKTNRYNMIFAPFTGKDNHGKCVTFGIGLVTKEDVGAYSWLFKKFQECMGHNPSMITTDQDPAMKIAIEEVMKGTRQRYCMWHIMRKVKDKVPSHLANDQTFIDKLSNVVYSDFLEPDEFDVQWNQIMDEYGLTNDTWFTSMFAIREMWIPAYFRDFPLNRLFRTTSMSESENCFFGRYANPRANLLEFYLNVESALESQRNTLDAVNSHDETNVALLETPLLFEKHASTLYSTTIFRKVQYEIVAACFYCRVVRMNGSDTRTIYDVEDRNNGVFNVVYEKEAETFVCSCKKFVREGLLCAHIFFLFKEMRLEKVPDKYVLSRWTKFAFNKTVYAVADICSFECDSVRENKMAMTQIMSEFYSCVGMADGNKEDMATLLTSLRNLKLSFTNRPTDSSTGPTVRKKLFDDHYGASIPDIVAVLPPSPVNNKGCRNRIKSSKEKAIEKMRKPLRKCSKCGFKTNHDARNCTSVLLQT